jgi:hypothetical protein
MEIPGERMRLGAILTLLVLAGCSSGLLDATTEPPSGIPVVVTTSFSPGIVATSGSVIGKGDSIVATVTRPATCGSALSADAGTAGAELVVTIVLSADAVQSCSALNGMTTYRATVHGLPAGTRDASVHVRLETLGSRSDTTVAHATVALP